MRGLPSAIGEGRYERKLIHSASERAVGYVFLIEESIQKYPNPHPYQTGSKGSNGAEPRRTKEYLRVPLDVEGAGRALAEHFDPDELYWAMVHSHRGQ